MRGSRPRIMVVGAGQRKVVDEDPRSQMAARCRCCSRARARCRLHRCQPGAVDNTCAQIASEGGNAFAEIVDVADAAAIAPVVERCARQLGGSHMLFAQKAWS